MDIYERWEAIDVEGDEYMEFDKVENKRSLRPDIHAFLLLDELFPGTRDMVCGASHDEFYLDVTEEQAETLPDSTILELIRCGVRYDSGGGGLCMFA